MRKLLGLSILLSSSALLALSCDEPPTAPETDSVQTQTPSSLAVLADRKSPPLPTPVVLAGAEIKAYAAGITTASRSSVSVQCSGGKWPISGGWRVLGGESSAFSVQTSAPVESSVDHGAWLVELIRTSGTGEWNLIAHAVCVSMQPN